jgi:hypothetical protein
LPDMRQYRNVFREPVKPPTTTNSNRCYSRQMDLWSDDPAERLAAAGDVREVGDWPRRIGAQAPMQPWPYGMPSPINPFVVFLGPSPGNSPPVGDSVHRTCDPYELPTAGNAHPGLFVEDGRQYWHRIREMGSMLIRAHVPAISEQQSHTLIGQLNLGTGQFGQAANAPFEPEYCRWVPEVVLDYLRPSYVIMLGLASRLSKPNAGFDPLRRLGINWKDADDHFPLAAYKGSRYMFRLWHRERPDGRSVRFVLWPQHPSRPPMTNGFIWTESAREFIAHVGMDVKVDRH